MGNVTRPRTAPKRSNRNAEANEAKLRELVRIKANFTALLKNMAQAHNNISKKIRAGTANVGDIATIQYGIPQTARKIKQRMAYLDKKVNVLIRRTLGHA
jgi:hypothetical protein